MITPIVANVCSYDLGLQLKQKGVFQDSLFQWIPTESKPIVGFSVDKNSKEICAAYTVGELLSIIPFEFCNLSKCTNSIDRDFFVTYGKWVCGEKGMHSDYSGVFAYGDTPAEAAANLLLKLIAEELV